MRFQKIPTTTLRHKVYHELRHKILSAEIVPGQSISIRDLASELGVSMMPVREALWQLESEKVIVIRSNRSIHVNRLTPKEMEEILQIRLIVESLAAERSCERRPDSVLPELKRLMEGMEACIGKPKRFITKNNQFHFTVYSFADSPLLLHIIDLLWARVSPYLFIQDARGDLSNSMTCHQDMYEAFVEKDKKRLTEALRKDLEGAAEFIIPFLEKSVSNSKTL